MHLKMKSEQMHKMNHPGARTLLLVLAAAAIAAPVFVQAQGAPAQNDAVSSVDISKPIVTRTPKESKPKNVKFTGAVLSSNGVSITVRSTGENTLLVRTFTYAPEIRDKMQQLLDRGGYQYGDKVTIESPPDSDVALSVKGKPSKSL